jgi:hypothetical protein
MQSSECFSLGRAGNRLQNAVYFSLRACDTSVGSGCSGDRVFQEHVRSRGWRFYRGRSCWPVALQTPYHLGRLDSTAAFLSFIIIIALVPLAIRLIHFLLFGVVRLIQQRAASARANRVASGCAGLPAARLPVRASSASANLSPPSLPFRLKGHITWTYPDHSPETFPATEAIAHAHGTRTYHAAKRVLSTSCFAFSKNNRPDKTYWLPTL